jgi:hypothetical protein
MTTDSPSLRGVLSPKGLAKPPPEPAVRAYRTTEGRRVGARLPTEVYVRFKGYVAKHGLTGEQAIVAAIGRLVAED